MDLEIKSANGDKTIFINKLIRTINYSIIAFSVASITFFFLYFNTGNKYYIKPDSINKIDSYNNIVRVAFQKKIEAPTKDSLLNYYGSLVSDSTSLDFFYLLSQSVKIKTVFFIDIDSANFKNLPKNYIEFLSPYAKIKGVLVKDLNAEINKKFQKDDQEKIRRSKALMGTYAISFYFLDTLKLKYFPEIVKKAISNLLNSKFNSRNELVIKLKRNFTHGEYLHFENFIINWVEYGSPFKERTLKISLFLCFITILLIILWRTLIIYEKENIALSKKEHEIQNAKAESREQPEKITPTYNIAFLTLQKYFDKNLNQIDQIFRISLIVMTVGFILIGIGTFYSITYPDKLGISIIATVSGVIIDFIGATFIFIYKSTIEQAMKYTEKLEKINNIGMSMTIIDGIKEGSIPNEDLGKAKIEISRLLIEKTEKVS